MNQRIIGRGRWARRRARAIAAQERGADGAARSNILDVVAGDHPVDLVWSRLFEDVGGQLDRADCRFVRDLVPHLPRIARVRSGAPAEVLDNDEVVLPRCGATVPVVFAGLPLGFLVVTPRSGAGVLRVSRSVVHYAADLVSLAVARSDALALSPPTARD